MKIDELKKEFEKISKYVFPAAIDKVIQDYFDMNQKYDALLDWITDKINSLEIEITSYNLLILEGVEVNNDYINKIADIANLINLKTLILSQQCTLQQRENIYNYICQKWNKEFYEKYYSFI